MINQKINGTNFGYSFRIEELTSYFEKLSWSASRKYLDGSLSMLLEQFVCGMYKPFAEVSEHYSLDSTKYNSFVDNVNGNSKASTIKRQPLSACSEMCLLSWMGMR